MSLIIAATIRWGKHKGRRWLKMSVQYEHDKSKTFLISKSGQTLQNGYRMGGSWLPREVYDLMKRLERDFFACGEKRLVWESYRVREKTLENISPADFVSFERPFSDTQAEMMDLWVQDMDADFCSYRPTDREFREALARC